MDYIVKDTSLTAVADAIRSKSGGNQQLKLPDGFVSEVEKIPSGELKWKATRNAFMTLGGNISNISYVEMDYNGYSSNVNPASYCATKKNAKLVIKGIGGLTVANQSASDLFRQCRSFKEIDFGGLAPSSMTRWFYQWNYGDNAADPPIIIRNLSLDNLASHSGGTLGNDSNTYNNGFNIYWIGTLKNSINLSSWTKLNANSWNRLIDCLYDYSDSEDTYTLTLGTTIINMLDEEHLDIAYTRGWTLA